MTMAFVQIDVPFVSFEEFRSGEEEEARLVHEFKLKRDRVIDSYRQMVERMVVDFSHIKKGMRALHLEERLVLNSKWEEDSQDTLNEFLDSKQFKSLSDEDFDRTLRKLAGQNKRQRQADLEELEKRHMADWRRFLCDKKTSLVQLQQDLERKLELLDREETQKIISLWLDLVKPKKSTTNRETEILTSAIGPKD